MGWSECKAKAKSTNSFGTLVMSPLHWCFSCRSKQTIFLKSNIKFCSLARRYKDDKTVFIIAGYEDQINDMLAVNAGMEGRFAKTIFFEDWSNVACVDMLVKEHKEFFAGGFKEGVEKALLDGFARLSDKTGGMTGWSNARDVNAMWERLFEERCGRIINLKGKVPKNILLSDVKNAVESFVKDRMKKKKPVYVASGPTPMQTRGQGEQKAITKVEETLQIAAEENKKKEEIVEEANDEEDFEEEEEEEQRQEEENDESKVQEKEEAQHITTDEKNLMDEFNRAFDDVDKDFICFDPKNPDKITFEGELSKLMGPLTDEAVDGIANVGFEYDENLEKALYIAADAYFLNGMSLEEAKAKAREEFYKWKDAQWKITEIKRKIKEAEEKRVREEEEAKRKKAEELQKQIEKMKKENKKKEEIQRIKDELAAKEAERIRNRVPVKRCWVCGGYGCNFMPRIVSYNYV